MWANVQKFGYALEPRPNTAYLKYQSRGGKEIHRFLSNDIVSAILGFGMEKTMHLATTTRTYIPYHSSVPR